MGRWEPDARRRLARAALVLSAQNGYEATTVAEIAAAADVTERTFYRHFTDKADALFPDNAGLLAHVARVTGEAVRRGNAPLEAALAAVAELARVAGEEPERVLLMSRVVPTVPALAGRDLVRQRQLVDAVAASLTEQGTPSLAARLAAETALGIWRVALTEWAADPDARSLPDAVAAVAGAARAL